MAERPRYENESSSRIDYVKPRVLTKAVNPRDESAQNWKRIDDLFYRTIGHAETAFKINLGINIIVVAVGITLIIYSIAYGWTKGLDIYTAAFGTLGVVSFVSTFYITPQRKIQETVGDLTQIQICYRTYAAQWEAINDYLYYHEQSMSLADLKEINSQLEALTCKSVDLIEKYISKKEDNNKTEIPPSQ